jgi:hypothetical protein
MAIVRPLEPRTKLFDEFDPYMREAKREFRGILDCISDGSLTKVSIYYHL